MYDYRNCQSLFGYAASVHIRSGGVCQLCGAGADRLDFDLWRQLTVEHLVGESQGGYPKQIRQVLAARYPDAAPGVLAQVADAIDAANTVTACGFCNSTTSRTRSPNSMAELLASAPDDLDAVAAHVQARLLDVLERKRADVRWKLVSVRRAYESLVLPQLRETRDAVALRQPEGEPD